MGIKNGLRGLEGGPDWRGPLADRLYLPTADGGRAITDALSETYRIVNTGRILTGKPLIAPKQGARFHFELPGSLQGFQVEPHSEARLENVEGYSCSGQRSLAIRYLQLTPEKTICIATPTFIRPDAINMPGYPLLASPTLYSGQTLKAALTADSANTLPVTCRPFVRFYGTNDHLVTAAGGETELFPGKDIELKWRIPATNGSPLEAVGVELCAKQETQGSVYLDYLTWDGAPEVVLTRPETGGKMWRRAWIDGLDQFEDRYPESYRLVQNYGRGMLIQGTRDWTDYCVSATLAPHMAQATGIGSRVQGMQRYYALLLSSDHQVRLIQVLDGEKVLAASSLSWELGRPYALSLQVRGTTTTRLQALIEGQLIFDVQDSETPLVGGGVALICEEGCVSCDTVIMQPAETVLS
jgi:hypothetical protein